MTKLTKSDLWSLEQYSERRPKFRNEILAHKKHRQIALDKNARLYFEDEKTVRYQIQEMLRIEKVFEAEGIDEELEAYNPLIPDGNNWKATFMLEFDDTSERRARLAELVGIEHKVWIQVSGFERIWSIANEDLERSTDEKTASVHFMRFQLTTEMISKVKAGAAIHIGIDHPNYLIEGVLVGESTHASLCADLTNTADNTIH